MKRYIIPILVLFFLNSCSSDHNITLNKDKSATVDFKVTNKGSLISTFLNWNSVTNSDTTSIVDVNEVKRGLSNNRSISNISVNETGNNIYEGHFNVTNLENIFSDPSILVPDNVKLFSITENGGITTFKMELSLENYRYLKQFLPILKEESIDMLGPDANIGTSKNEYLDMIGFSLGDKGPDDLLNSNINIIINIDGTILNVVNGRKMDNNSVSFKIPLLDVILLQNKLVYTFTYK